MPDNPLAVWVACAWLGLIGFLTMLFRGTKLLWYKLLPERELHRAIVEIDQEEKEIANRKIRRKFIRLDVVGMDISLQFMEQMEYEAIEDRNRLWELYDMREMIESELRKRHAQSASRPLASHW